jgi:hypothetical protein
VRGVLRELFRRGDHDCLHLIDADAGWPTRVGSVKRSYSLRIVEAWAFDDDEAVVDLEAFRV